VTVVAVDATAVQSLASKYKVEGFPTIKVFGENKGAPTDYQGARESPAIVQFAMKEVAALVQARAGGGGGGKKGGKSGGGGGGGGGSKPASETGGGKSVVTLTAANFDELVLGGPEAWLVECASSFAFALTCSRHALLLVIAHARTRARPRRAPHRGP
jgi:protein disulfide-isomerase A6